MDQVETMPFEATMAQMAFSPKSPPNDFEEVEHPAQDAENDVDAAAMQLLLTKRTLFLGEEATPDGEEPPTPSFEEPPCPTEFEENPQKKDSPFNALECQAISCLFFVP